MDQYRIDDAGGLALLQTAAEAADRAESCRAQIEQDGEVVHSRNGPKAHPLLTVERDARNSLLRAVRHLNLDVAPARPVGRPAGSRNAGFSR